MPPRKRKSTEVVALAPSPPPEEPAEVGVDEIDDLFFFDTTPRHQVGLAVVGDDGASSVPAQGKPDCHLRYIFPSIHFAC